jgi:hypothetical protein
MSASSSLASWTAELKDGECSTCLVSWILIYRDSISGYLASDFHRACDGMGKYVCVVKSANGRIAAAYNEDSFASDGDWTPNRNGFIASVDEEGERGEINERNYHKVGI